MSSLSCCPGKCVLLTSNHTIHIPSSSYWLCLRFHWENRSHQNRKPNILPLIHKPPQPSAHILGFLSCHCKPSHSYQRQTLSWCSEFLLTFSKILLLWESYLSSALVSPCLLDILIGLLKNSTSLTPPPSPTTAGLFLSHLTATLPQERSTFPSLPILSMHSNLFPDPYATETTCQNSYLCVAKSKGTFIFLFPLLIWAALGRRRFPFLKRTIHSLTSMAEPYQSPLPNL